MPEEREREVNTWQGDQARRVDNTLPNLRSALEQLKPKLEAMGVVRIIGGAEAYAKGISPGLQIILDDSINSIALIKLEVQYKDGHTDEIFIEAWNDPQNHLSGAATSEVFVQRIKDALKIQNSEQTSPDAQDAYNWDDWGTPPDRTLSREEFLTPDFLLQGYPQLSLRQVVDGNWPRSTYKVEVFVRSKSTVIPVVFGIEMFGLMSGILESKAKVYRQKLAALIERAKAEGKPVEVRNIDRVELPGQAMR